MSDATADQLSRTRYVSHPLLHEENLCNRPLSEEEKK